MEIFCSLVLFFRVVSNHKLVLTVPWDSALAHSTFEFVGFSSVLSRITDWLIRGESLIDARFISKRLRCLWLLWLLSDLSPRVSLRVIIFIGGVFRLWWDWCWILVGRVVRFVEIVVFTVACGVLIVLQLLQIGCLLGVAVGIWHLWRLLRLVVIAKLNEFVWVDGRWDLIVVWLWLELVGLVVDLDGTRLLLMVGFGHALVRGQSKLIGAFLWDVWCKCPLILTQVSKCILWLSFLNICRLWLSRFKSDIWLGPNIVTGHHMVGLAGQVFMWVDVLSLLRWLFN